MPSRSAFRRVVLSAAGVLLLHGLVIERAARPVAVPAAAPVMEVTLAPPRAAPVPPSVPVPPLRPRPARAHAAPPVAVPEPDPPPVADAPAPAPAPDAALPAADANGAGTDAAASAPPAPAPVAEALPDESPADPAVLPPDVPPASADGAADAPPTGPTDALPAVPPPPARLALRFDAWLEGLGGDVRIGDARFTLDVEDGRYLMRLDARGPLASFAYRSEGRTDGAGFRPDRFSERREVGLRAARTRDVAFVTTPRGEGALARVPGMQDRLSVLFQLWLLVRSDPAALSPGREFRLPLASTSRVDMAVFRVVGPEAVEVGDTVHQAWRIERLRRRPDDAGIELWLGEAAGGLPVALRYTERGRAFRFVMAP